MGICGSTIDDHQTEKADWYKCNDLVDIFKIIQRSPSDGQALIDSGDINKAELVNYKWNGMNILHMVEMLMCADTTKHDDLNKLRTYLITAMPVLDSDIVKQNIEIFYGNSTFIKGTCDHSDRQLHVPSNVYPDCDTMVIYTDCKSVTCKLGTIACSKAAKHYMTIRKDMSRAEYKIYLVSINDKFKFDKVNRVQVDPIIVPVLAPVVPVVVQIHQLLH